MAAKHHIVTVGLVQMRCTAQPSANLKRALALVEKAAKRGAQIVCLPELFRSLYFCQTEDHSQFALAEPIPGPTTAALATAARAHRITIVGSIFEKRSAGVYHNTAVIIDAERQARWPLPQDAHPRRSVVLRKILLHTGRSWLPSRSPPACAAIGMLVCWDQWYPEAARLTALKGAQILFYPTAIGWHLSEKKQFGAKQHDAWVTIQRSHAIANGVFVAAPNRIGLEGTVQFWGGSFVCDPFGEMIAEASHDKEEVLIAKCDLRKVDVTRQHWPFLRDRRIDAYGGITQRLLD